MIKYEDNSSETGPFKKHYLCHLFKILCSSHKQEKCKLCTVYKSIVYIGST